MVCGGLLRQPQTYKGVKFRNVEDEVSERPAATLQGCVRQHAKESQGSLAKGAADVASRHQGRRMRGL